MKQSFIIVFGFLISITACHNLDRDNLHKETKKQLNEKNILKAANILNDFNNWYNYTYYNIHLAQDFIALDTNSSAINKKQFLEDLATGKFVPLKINSESHLPNHQLYKLNKNDSDITSTISQMATTEILHLKMEGKELPDYNFQDLKGRNYKKSITKGKMVVIKCWYIHCLACVREFPELNVLVNEYKNREDILFISLAMDSEKDLLSFLSKNPFNYSVIPNVEKYMNEQLNITEYPTHILVDKNGKIVKVVNAINDLMPFIKKQAEQTSI